MTPEQVWTRATRITAAIVALLFVVLLATGLALTFRYRPDVSASFASVSRLEDRPWFTARRVHRLAAALFVPAVGCLAVASIGLFLARRSRGRIALSLLAGVVALAAAFTGYLLPWDQLSLWTVTVGNNMSGYTAILGGDRVRYVLVGSSEVGTATLSRWFWLHAVVLPVVLVGVVTILVVMARRRDDRSDQNASG